MNHILLTMDVEWDAIGGDPQIQALEPTRRFLQLTRRLGIEPILFVDVLGFRRHPHQGDQLHKLLGDQRCGLHLHPEHCGAGTSCGELLDPGPLLDLALDWLPNRPLAFRAGGWQVAPGEHLLPALQARGIKVDCSLMPGRYLDDVYDHRFTPQLPAWKTGKTIFDVGDGLWSLPIATGKMGIALDLISAARRGHLGNGRAAHSRRWFSRAKTLGFGHLDLGSRSLPALKTITNAWQQQFTKFEQLPLVISSHSQTFDDRVERRTERYLRWLLSQDGMVPSTFERWLSVV